jgi:PKHD-type hydroxylase
MILCISDVLNKEMLARLSTLLNGATFEDGRATAGWSAQAVKHNSQLAAASPGYDTITGTVQDALVASLTLQAAALPLVYRPPLISRYEVGMAYGPHIDNALMGRPLTRADLSYTLFLSAPDDYEGGELVLEDTHGEHTFKLQAGAMVLYPATYQHRVESVQTGLRLVAVGWIQSACRSAEAREILFDLHRLLTAEFATHGKTAEFDLLTKTRSNLLRMLAEV